MYVYLSAYYWLYCCPLFATLHYNRYHFTLFSCYFVIWKFGVQLYFNAAKLWPCTQKCFLLYMFKQLNGKWMHRQAIQNFMDNCRNNLRTVEVKWVKEMFSLTLSGYRCHFAEQKRDRFVAWDWCPWFKHIRERQQT